jgi:hypothetical protein
MPEQSGGKGLLPLFGRFRDVLMGAYRLVRPPEKPASGYPVPAEILENRGRPDPWKFLFNLGPENCSHIAA